MKPRFKIYLKTFWSENDYYKMVLFSPQNSEAILVCKLYDAIPVSYFTDRFEPVYIIRFYEN